MTTIEQDAIEIEILERIDALEEAEQAERAERRELAVLELHGLIKQDKVL